MIQRFPAKPDFGKYPSITVTSKTETEVVLVLFVQASEMVQFWFAALTHTKTKDQPTIKSMLFIEHILNRSCYQSALLYIYIHIFICLYIYIYILYIIIFIYLYVYLYTFYHNSRAVVACQGGLIATVHYTINDRHLFVQLSGNPVCYFFNYFILFSTT